jgi:hypothetical protein
VMLSFVVFAMGMEVLQSTTRMLYVLLITVVGLMCHPPKRVRALGEGRAEYNKHKG